MVRDIPWMQGPCLSLVYTYISSWKEGRRREQGGQTIMRRSRQRSVLYSLYSMTPPATGHPISDTMAVVATLLFTPHWALQAVLLHMAAMMPWLCQQPKLVIGPLLGDCDLRLADWERIAPLDWLICVRWLDSRCAIGPLLQCYWRVSMTALSDWLIVTSYIWRHWQSFRRSCSCWLSLSVERIQSLKIESIAII